jgi:hypothetical protein
VGMKIGMKHTLTISLFTYTYGEGDGGNRWKLISIFLKELFLSIEEKLIIVFAKVCAIYFEKLLLIVLKPFHHN